MVKVGDGASANATVIQHSSDALFQHQCTPGWCLTPLVEQQVGGTIDNLCLLYLFHFEIVEEIPLTTQRILTDCWHKKTITTIKDDDDYDYDNEKRQCFLICLILRDNNYITDKKLKTNSRKCCLNFLNLENH